MELLLFIRSITQCFRMYRTIISDWRSEIIKALPGKNQTTPFHLSACQITRLILEVVFDRSQVNQHQQAFFFGRRCLFCRNCSVCQLTVKRRERWKSLWHRHVLCVLYNFPWERLSSLLTKNSTKRNEDLFKNKMEETTVQGVVICVAIRRGRGTSFPPYSTMYYLNRKQIPNHLGATPTT